MALQFVRRQIANAAIDATKLDTNAIITAKINNGAVTADKLASDAVSTVKIADDAVTSAKIADGAVIAAALGAGAVLTAALADDAVTSAKIADDAIITALIADDAITSALIADDAVVTAAIADDAIVAALIADNAVVTAGINNGAVTAAKADLSSAIWNYGAGKLQVGSVDVATMNDIAGLAWKDSVRVVATGNGTLSSAYANGQTVDGVTLATNDRILLAGQTSAAANGLYVVKASGAPDRASDLPAGNMTGEKAVSVFVREGTANADTAWVLATDGAINIGSTAINFAQQSHLAELIGGTGLTKSGSTISITQGGVGANELGANAVVTAKINAGAVTTAKLADDAVTSAKIADDAIVSAAIADNAVLSDHIATGAVVAGGIAAGAVVAAGLASNAVETAKINNAAVTQAKIGNNAVKSGQLGMAFKMKGFAGDGSATQFALDDDVPNDFRAGILVFVNGQAYSQKASGSPGAGEFVYDVNSGNGRITLSDVMSNSEQMGVFHMVDLA